MILIRVVTGLVTGLTLLAWTVGTAHAEAAPADPAGPAHHAAQQAPGESDAHPADSGPGEVNTDPLEFQTDLALWTLVVFLVLLAVLWKFAWGPIAEGLNRREQGIADQITQAEQANRQAKELLGQYDQKLVGAKQEVRQILDKAQHDAEQVGRGMIEKAQQEAEAEQQRALQQIDAATAGALKELADRGATLAVELAGKIVRAELKPDDHARLIRQTMADFTQRPPSQN